MKTLVILKRQQFKDSRSDKTEPRGSKYQRLDKRDNKEENGLDEDEGKIKSAKYVSPPFIFLSLLFQKVSNCLSNLGKRIRSLNYLIYIPKVCYLRVLTLHQSFQIKKISKHQKKIHTSRLREELESYLASTAFTVSNTINYRYLIRKRLESHPLFNHCQDLETQFCTNQQQGFGSYPTTTTSSLFTNIFDILEVTSLPIKTLIYTSLYGVDIIVA